MKKNYILILCLLAFTFNTYSQDCNIGNETLPGSPLSVPFTSNYLLGVKHTLSQEGTLNAINYVGNGTGTGIQMAIYDDNGGTPNNLIVTSSLATVGNGVVSLAVTPTVLPAGDYWIMAVYQTTGNHSDVYSSGTNTVYYNALTYGNPIPNNAAGFPNYSGHNFLYFLDITCGDTLSIEDFNLQNNIKLFPNPSSDFIQISGIMSTKEYSLCNILGKEIVTGIISSNEKIDIKNLSKGIYLLKLSDNTILRFIKN